MFNIEKSSDRMVFPFTYHSRYAAVAVVCILMTVAFLPVVQPADGEERSISFNRDIRPILSDKCYACHGPDANQRKKELRFDTKEGAFSETSGYPVIVPGNPQESELVLRITNEDESQRMPPADQERQLTQEQIKLLTKWIEQGAKWEDHWIYIPPKRSPMPEVRDKGWSKNAIDHFVLARLESERLTPSPEADRRTLIRRLSFDLTGLPPTPAEVDAFLQDGEPDAYEKIVDRILSSPHYGERMAMHWLDLVRYADTSGYHSDENVSVWPYRDYVIRAFNDNMRYDRFTRENLAGDLLPNATLEQKVAAAYNRLNQTTAEGGAQAKEYHAIYAADRVRATSTVWMGATMGCAQCHDHKFDPYTIKDFYSFAAFFADIEERGVYRSRSQWEPIVLLPTEEQVAELKKIDDELARLQAQYNAPRPEFDIKRATWETETISLLNSSEPSELVWVDDEEDNGGKTSGDWKLIRKAEAPVFSGTSSRQLSVTADQTIQYAFQGAKRKITLSIDDQLFAHVWLDPENPPKTIMLQWNDGNWEHRAFWGEDRIEYGSIGEDKPAHKPMGPLPATGKWVRLEVDPVHVGLKPGSVLNGMAFTQFGGTAYWDMAGIVTTEASHTRHRHPSEVLKSIQVDPVIRTQDQRKVIDAYYRTIMSELAFIRDEIEASKQKRAGIEAQVPYCITTVSVPPRTMRVLPRGNWMDDSGEIVEPNTPEFLPPLKGVKLRRATRLDLANWLLLPENPMTSRAFVNRFWKLFLGTGISGVLDDLGSQGEWPEHPELLDWLAVEFMESEWNIKHMVKLMVTSNTYRQSSKLTGQLREKDPYNRLLARQSHYRLDAEMVRDNALFVSGLLVDKLGGSSVKPYQPKGYYFNLNFPKRVYKHDDGEGQYRRGLYTHWQRTFLHPSMMAFDAPSRQECTVERARSNTPLQALTLLNDPSYVEAARVFAARIIKEGGDSVGERINWAYRWALSRQPTPTEATIMTTLYKKHRDEYRQDTASVGHLVKTGEWPVPADIAQDELAAWTSVARVVLNLHETIMRY